MRAVVPADVRHFGSQAYGELSDIRRAGLHEHGTPFFLFSLLFSFSLFLPPLLLCRSLSLSLLSFHLSFFLLFSLALSHTPVDLLGGGSHRYTRQVFGQYKPHRTLTEYLKSLKLVSRG